MKLSFIGLIGDIHAESQRLEAALRFMDEARVERILCVGDIVDGDGNADKCCQLLEHAGVAVVRGNHDRWLIGGQMRELPGAIRLEDLSEGSRSFIAALPGTLSFETVAGKLLLCHGVGENDMQMLTLDDYGYALQFKDELHELIGPRKFRFMIGGHTHRRMVRNFEHLTVINAGTLYDGHEPCVALADFHNMKVTFHNFVGNRIERSGEAIALNSIK